MKNKKALIFMILVIIGLVIIGFIGFWKYNKSSITNKPIEFPCNSSLDCMKIQTSCCECSSGGEEICGTLEQAEEYKTKLNDCEDETYCVTVYNCEIEACDCINNKCVGLGTA